MTCKILLNNFLRTWSLTFFREDIFREDIETTLEDIDELSIAHGLFFEFFLYLVVDGFEIFSS